MYVCIYVCVNNARFYTLDSLCVCSSHALSRMGQDISLKDPRIPVPPACPSAALDCRPAQRSARLPISEARRRTSASILLRSSTALTL